MIAYDKPVPLCYLLLELFYAVVYEFDNTATTLTHEVVMMLLSVGRFKACFVFFEMMYCCDATVRKELQRTVDS